MWVYSLDLLLAWRSRFSNFGGLGLVCVFDCLGVFGRLCWVWVFDGLLIWKFPLVEWI